MVKTITYTNWPKNTNFVDGIEKIVNTIKNEFRCRVTKGEFRKADSTYYIYIDDNEHIRFESYQQFVQYFKTIPVYKSFTCNMTFSTLSLRTFFVNGLWINMNRHSVEITTHSDNNHFIDRVQDIAAGILKLEKPNRHDVDDYRAKYLNPNIFVSRHFDVESTSYYSEIADFLGLLGFSVIQGEEYTSGSIPEKVKHRMDQQDIVLVVVSGERDHDWLIAEIGYATGTNKHVIIMKEKGTNMNMTIMGRDFEYIEFEKLHIQNGYCKLLREFRSIRVKGIF